jgi:undecaprenyl-diphosphatase
VTTARSQSTIRRDHALDVDAGTQLGLALVGLSAFAVGARRRTLAPLERRLFRRVNNLPEGVAVAAWPLMQLGALGAAPLLALAAWVDGERRVAVRLIVRGTVSWVLAKVVKRLVGRPRPAVLVDATRFRGAAPSGLGFVSGHAAVSAALAAEARRWLGFGPGVEHAAVAAVCFARVHVGAHLPLDVAGGVALGTAVDAACTLAERRLLPHRCDTVRPSGGATAAGGVEPC